MRNTGSVSFHNKGEEIGLLFSVLIFIDPAAKNFTPQEFAKNVWQILPDEIKYSFDNRRLTMIAQKPEIDKNEIFNFIKPICLAYKNDHHCYDGELPDFNNENRLWLACEIEEFFKKHDLNVSVPHTLWAQTTINGLAEKIVKHLNNTGIKRIKPPAPDITVADIQLMDATMVQYCIECHQAYDFWGKCACYYKKQNGFSHESNEDDELDAEIDEGLKKMGKDKDKNNVISMFSPNENNEEE